MGVMNNLRENTGVMLWILVFAFGVIWVLQDSGGLEAVGNLNNTIATVNGSAISIEEYQLEVDRQVQSYQNQTEDSMPPQMLDQTRDRVFNQLVEARLREQEMARLGIEVSDDELIDMIQGVDPHPIIKASFSDGEGGIDRILLQNFIADPNATANWLYIEQLLISERRSQKLENLIGATVRVTEKDVRQEHIRRNRNVDVDYVSLRFTALSDDDISYDDVDLRRFYNDHKDEFSREKTFDLSYATMSKAPTSDDTLLVFSDLVGMMADFSAAENDSLFLARNGSERPYTDAYFRRDEIADEMAEAVFSDVKTGIVVGPIVSGGQVHLIKVMDVRAPEETAVKASHILFRAADGDDDAIAEARTEANSVRRRILAGEDFADLAREFSDDATASRGGDLGWFGPGRMVTEFEDAAFGARIDRVVGPIKTQFGYHLIMVTDKATQEAQLADYALSLRASVQTLNRVQGLLDDLQYFSTEEGNFSDEAERRDLMVRTVSVGEKQQFIPGLGNSRALLNFLETASEGDVSPVIELNDVFFVASVDGVTKAGFQPFDDVKSQLEPRVRNEMKAEIQASKLQNALGAGGFDTLAESVSTSQRSASGLSFSNLTVPGIGRDPLFVGTAMGIDVGAISEVVTGSNSVYVIRVSSIAEPGALQPSDFTTLQDQLTSQRQNLVRSRWITALRESADIVDNRRFYLQ